MFDTLTKFSTYFGHFYAIGQILILAVILQKWSNHLVTLDGANYSKKSSCTLSVIDQNVLYYWSLLFRCGTLDVAVLINPGKMLGANNIFKH